MAVKITVEHTPNPNAVKFSANETIFADSTSVKSDEATDHPLAKQLIAIPGVDNLFGLGDFVTINKSPDAVWEDIITNVKEVFERYETN